MKSKKLLLAGMTTAFVLSSSVAAFAALPNGSIVLGNKAYDGDALVNVALFNEISQAYKDADYTFNYKGYTGQWVNDLNEAINASSIPAVTLKKGDGTTESYAAGDGDVVTDPTQEELKVESVSAINAAEIQVVFGTKVNKTSAETALNYTATLPGALALGTPKLQDDGKTVIIPITGGTLAVGSSYKVNVKNVLDTNYNKIAEFTDTLKLFSDITGPSVVKAELTSANKVRVWFNEPVAATFTVKIDGQSVVGALTASTTAGKYYVDTPVVSGALLAPGTHTVTLYNVADIVSGTPNTQSVLTTTYTATADTTAPSVTSIEADTANTFYVTFSEPIASVADANLVIKKGNFTFPAARVAETQDLVADPTGATWLITLTAADTDNPLFATGENSVNLSVKVTGYKDASNLLGADYNGSVTLSKDLTGPTIESPVLNTVNAGAKTITLQFNEDIDAAVTAGLITVKKDGITIPVAEAVRSGTDKVVITLDPDHTVTPGTYTVELAAGAVKDLSLNNNAAITTTAEYTGAATALVIAADNDGIVGNQSIGINSAEPNVLTINFGEDMEDSAAVLANYKLDGNAFPAGTTIGFYGNKQTVKITLPAAYFPANTTGLVKIDPTVKSKAGKIVAASVNPTVAVEAMITNFTDNVKPTLDDAKLFVSSSTATTTDKIKLYFSEDLNTVLGAVDLNKDFKVTVNGVEQTVTVVDTVPGDDVLMLQTGAVFNVSQPVVVTVSGVDTINTSVDVKDIAGNKLTTGTTLNVTAKEVDSITAGDSASVAADKAALNLTYSGTGNLVLPATGANGSTITWNSNTPAIINNAGVVTRSTADNTDDVVVMTATITKGSVTDTKTFNITVPEGLVPTVASAASNSTTTVELTLDEALAGTTADPAAFTVVKDPAGTPSNLTVSSVAVSGTTVTITLDAGTPIANGDVIEVTYAATGTTDLQDAKGNVVANFAGQSVTNNN
ncbi:Ig-like domain-containing protein [Bacillota bacterium LX-D]|nr:Ig-like domain-containing protein [Bacillota bacterium LX-D]